MMIGDIKSLAENSFLVSKSSTHKTTLDPELLLHQSRMNQAQILLKTIGFLVIIRFSDARYLLVEVDNIAGDGDGQEGIIKNPYFGIIALFYI